MFFSSWFIQLLFLCFLHTCCSPLLPTSPHRQFIVGTIAMFLMFTCDSLFASFQSTLHLISAFRGRNIISHFLPWSHYLWILTFPALFNCHLLNIFHCQSFVLWQIQSFLYRWISFSIDNRRELGWNFVNLKRSCVYHRTFLNFSVPSWKEILLNTGWHSGKFSFVFPAPTERLLREAQKLLFKICAFLGCRRWKSPDLLYNQNNLLSTGSVLATTKRK